MNPNDIIFGGKRVGDMQRDELVVMVAALDHQISELVVLVAGIDSPRSIESNQVIPQSMTLALEDSVLETYDGAGDMVEDIGEPVRIAPYKPPRDKRVQHLVQAAREREAAAKEEVKPRQIFTDPRLDPNYKPPKK
ncbi:hypothetical protein [Bradyrhizobium sp. NAS80.1]|uniref:hypothetical protein n=1 Tax=Bradyrhizobium sp. NAS80.1 TaxID=1680159 RepID=UPI0011614E82|nr:hypothetical protein [Bradyrhizobium sp. NAS80.1]